MRASNMEAIKSDGFKPKLNHLRIKVDNLKCGGCATSIEMGLLAMNGVAKAHVFEESNEVDVTYEEGTDLAGIKAKLKQLGYPEAGSTEGIDKIAANVKSYVSCAIGKLNNKDDQKH
jgi:copper chaperone